MKSIRTYIALVGIMPAFAFCQNSGGNASEFRQEFPLSIPVEDSQLSYWAKKEVKDSLLIDDMEGKLIWKKSEGIATISYTNEHAVDGKQALRFRTSLRDTVHLMRPENRTEWGSFGGQQGGGSKFGITFEQPQDWSTFNRVSIWVYIQPSRNPIHHFFLEIINQGTDYNTITPRKDNISQNLEQGKWINVVWEIPHYERDKVKQFNIFHTSIGYNPEGEDIITYDFDRLQMQRVETDPYEGWQISGEQFTFSHVGYRPQDSKVAMTGKVNEKRFQLIATNGKTVYEGDVQRVENVNGKFCQLDFSAWQTPGVYRIKCGTAVSEAFPINKNIWLHPLFSSINFYFCQRCGFDVPGIHGVCHEDWQGFRGDEKKVINGGWHDAGDLSQGHYRTALGVYALLRNLNLVKDDPKLVNLTDKLRDEAIWGLKWLLKTRFSDGSHISWARQRIYSDNIIGTMDDVAIRTTIVPWENFLGSAAENLAATLLKGTHPELADEARQASIINWETAIATNETWEKASYREAAWGAVSSIKLYQMTSEEKYKEYAVRFGKLLAQCQEQAFVEGIPITGYFYTDSSKKQILHNNHGAWEEAPLLALRELCTAFPEHPDWINWYSSAVLYSDFFMKRGSEMAAPYYLLPNSVFRKADILADRNEYRKKYSLIQYNDGTQLNENYALRTFPIWDGELFHGGTSCHLSSSWALAEASLLRGDEAGLQLVGKQLEWAFGNNPFGQSLMYGVGYNFAPQFAYCTKCVVGSLAVGMDCMQGDEPFWSGSNYATSKEMWIAPVNRVVGTIAAYMEGSFKPKATSTSSVQLTVIEKKENGEPRYTLQLKGAAGKHTLSVKAFNATSASHKQVIALTKNRVTEIPLDVQVIDKQKPYVLVVSVDNAMETKTEIVGAYY